MAASLVYTPDLSKCLVVESVGYSDQVSEINKIIDEEVNKVMQSLGHA